MAVMDQLVGLVSPTVALRRARSLRDSARGAEAFPLFARAAKAGLADAEFGVAQSYLEGVGVPASRPEAVRWLKRAATHDSVDAQALLSSLCLQGLARADSKQDKGSGAQLFADDTSQSGPDYEGAMKWARKAAAGGSAPAHALLGYILTSGPESVRNFDLAHRCFEQSASAGCPQGHLGFALSLARRARDTASWRRVTEELQHASDAGLLTAKFLLAVLHDDGAAGLERDPERAMELYQEAAERGMSAAQVRLGLALIEGRNVKKDLVAGESWLRQAAHGGDARAAFLVGNLYARGGPLPPNYTEAASWYRRAAEAGDREAARALASLYLTGAGTPQDKQEAERLLRQAAEAGDVAARVDLANIVAQGGGDAKDPARIMQWFADAAVTGDMVASFNIGICLAKGVGVERNETEAARWLRDAAEGVPEAQYIYGRMLAEGRGVRADLREARTWFARAAEAGVIDGQVALAEMYLNGRGGNRSTARALDLFDKAATKGHSGAMFALGAIFAAGRDVPLDRASAQKWFRAAAERGHGHAQLMLGRYLISGVAGKLDLVEGRKWLEQAVAQGIAEAEADLAAAPALRARSSN